MDHVLSQWQQFVQHGHTPQDVRAEVAASWQRCRRAGIDPQQASIGRLAESLLGPKVEAHKALLAIAEPQLRWLTGFFPAMECIAYIADRDGIVLAAVGAQALLETTGFQTGCDRSENSIGTSALALALANPQPYTIVGAEHYCAQFHPFACTAAPLHDTKGSVIGLVGLCTPVAPAGPERLALVAHLARAIEQAYVAVEPGRVLRTGLDDPRFRVLIEHSWDIVSLVDRDGTILYTSPSAKRFLGYDEDEIIGRNCFEFVHPDDFESTTALFTQMVNVPGSRVRAHYRQRHKNGQWLYMEGSGLNLLHDPAIGAIVVNYRDISERWQGEEALRVSEQRFTRFMQYLPGLAWIKDIQGRYLFANDAAEKAFGTPRANLYGKTDVEVFPPSVAAQFQDHDRQALASGTGLQVVETLEHEDGLLHYSLVSKFPIAGPHGEFTMIGGMAIDITEQVRAENALKEADRTKDEFLAMLAHELRNPLAPIRNALHILQQPTAHESTAQQARGMIERQVVHMAHLLDDLLDVARIGRGKIVLRKEPTDLNAVISRSCDAVRGRLEERRHELNVTLPANPVRVEGDPTRLEQIVTNLLNNACKYTNPGGNIWLSLEREGGDAILRMRDNGIGIAPDMLPQIFELFVQAQPPWQRSEAGVGIGLTLVRKLVELHEGTITAQSPGLGRGSEFIVHLPALDREPARRSSGSGLSSLERVARTHRILIVDDNMDAADSLGLLLRLVGQEVRIVYDGAAALAQVPSFQPDLVFLDIGMPEMDGYEVARRLSELPQRQDLFLVALTGWGQEQDKQRSRAAGFDQHIVKPVDPQTLHSLLDMRKEAAGVH